MQKQHIGIIVLVLAVLALAGFITHDANQRREVARYRAARRVKLIVTAERTYAAMFPGIGFACELKRLGPSPSQAAGNLGDPAPDSKPDAAGLIDAGLASGRRHRIPGLSRYHSSRHRDRHRLFRYRPDRLDYLLVCGYGV